MTEVIQNLDVYEYAAFVFVVCLGSISAGLVIADQLILKWRNRDRPMAKRDVIK